jgi:hypothetical protein
VLSDICARLYGVYTTAIQSVVHGGYAACFVSGARPVVACVISVELSGVGVSGSPRTVTLDDLKSGK